MAYFAPYVDSSGLNIPSYDDVLQHLVDKFKEIYGNDIYLDNDSQDYQMISAFALKTYDAFQTALLVYNNSSPSTAIGSSLDRLVAINGISRKAKSFSTVSLDLVGLPGTELSYASVKDQNGNIWQLNPDLVFPESGTLTEIATCSTPGSIQAAANIVNIINTPTSGWISANNPGVASPGLPIENDSDLKARREFAVSLPSLTVFEGLVASVAQLPGISKVKGYENDTGSTVNTILPHSIAIVALGGADADIAEAIYHKKTPGAGTFGSTSVVVTGANNEQATIKFSRPTNKALTIVVNVKKLASWDDSLKEVIKANIVNFVNEMEIGQSLYVMSDLATPISLANPDFSNLSFYMTSVTANGASDIVSVGLFELASVALANITVNAV